MLSILYSFIVDKLLSKVLFLNGDKTFYSLYERTVQTIISGNIFVYKCTGVCLLECILKHVK